MNSLLPMILKFALSYMNIFAGVTIMLSSPSQELVVTLKPGWLNPLAGSLEAANTKWGMCRGKFVIDLDDESAVLNFDSSTGYDNPKGCENENIIVSVSLNMDEYGDFLQGIPIEAQFNHFGQDQMQKTAMIKVLR